MGENKKLSRGSKNLIEKRIKMARTVPKKDGTENKLVGGLTNLPNSDNFVDLPQKRKPTWSIYQIKKKQEGITNLLEKAMQKSNEVNDMLLGYEERNQDNGLTYGDVCTYVASIKPTSSELLALLNTDQKGAKQIIDSLSLRAGCKVTFKETRRQLMRYEEEHSGYEE